MGLAKGVLPFYLLTLLPLCAAAQSKNVTVEAVGQLSQQISNDEKFKISELKVSGPLNSADIKLFQQIVCRTKASDKKGECVVTSVDISEAVFTEGKEGLPTSALPNGLFSGAGKLTKVVLPSGITSLGKSCFEDCASLTEVQIPESVTVLDDETFKGCENLSSVTIPQGVTKLGEEVFEICKALTSIEIPDGVTSIG